MRTEAEYPPIKIVSLETTGGFLGHRPEASWERLLKPEMIHGQRRAGHTIRRITKLGVLLSSISATTLILAEIYRRLDGAITGVPIETLTPLSKGLAAATFLGLALVLGGRFVSSDRGVRRQPARSRDKHIRSM